MNKEIKGIMIHDFRIMKSGLDFMGYEVKKREQLSFHHLIIPKRLCKELGYGDGYLYWNGAILVQKTSHDYLHLIERTDRNVFDYITEEMVNINECGRLELEYLRKIHDALKQFEKEYCSTTAKSGKMLIKKEYVRRPKL